MNIINTADSTRRRY